MSWLNHSWLYLFPIDERVGSSSQDLFLLIKLEFIFVHESLFGFQITFLFKHKSEMTDYECFKASDLYFWIVFQNVHVDFFSEYQLLIHDKYRLKNAAKIP